MSSRSLIGARRVLISFLRVGERTLGSKDMLNYVIRVTMFAVWVVVVVENRPTSERTPHPCNSSV
jgi:hypothetical protein